MRDRTSPDTLGKYIHARPIARSKGRAWSNVSVHLLAHQPEENSLFVPAVAEPLLVWIVSGSVTIEERDLGGSWLSNTVSAGDFYLTHTPSPYELRWKALSPEPFVVMHVYLGLPLYEQAVAELLGDPGQSIRLKDVSGQRDATISHLLEMIRMELSGRAEPSEMYVQGLAHALAIYLVRTYGDKNAPATARKGLLPAFKLQRVTRLMEDGLAERFNLEVFAREAGLSAFHFSRAFKQSTGYSPSAYFIQLRIIAAQRLLRETEKSILEIALDLGYASPSHFAQVFRHAVGTSPSDYRR